MKQIKLLSMFVALICALSFVSCGEDESGPNLSGYNDYFMSVKVDGGGWSHSELKTFETALNLELLDISDYLEGVRKDEAIEVFDEIVDQFEYEWRNGASDVTEPLYVKFFLETVDDGYVVKSKTVTVKPAKNNAPENRGVVLLEE